MKNSVYYIIYEGLSKGGSHLILFLLALYVNQENYLAIMLLLSLETMLPLFVLSNYNEILYKLKEKYSLQDMIGSLLITTLSTIGAFLLIFLLLQHDIYLYFGYDGIIVYLAILFNVFLVVTFRFFSISHQIEEDHTKALRYKSLPFFLSFLGIILAVFICDDKVFAFFIGKSLGYISALFFLKMHTYFKVLVINRVFIIEYMERAKFLILVGLFGWLSNYGFFNILHVFYSKYETLQFGYMLNILMLFLLLANGINQVYYPKVRKLFAESNTNTINFSIKILFLYFFLSLIASILLLFINHFVDLFNEQLKMMINIAPYAIIVFTIASFRYVSLIYIYIYDQYKSFSIVMIITEIISFSVVTLMLVFEFNIFITYLIFIIDRSVITILYTHKLLRSKDKL